MYVCEEICSPMKLFKTVYKSKLTDGHLTVILKIVCSHSSNLDNSKIIRRKR